jgi:hypothetical protein
MILRDVCFLVTPFHTCYMQMVTDKILRFFKAYFLGSYKTTYFQGIGCFEIVYNLILPSSPTPKQSLNSSFNLSTLPQLVFIKVC